MRQKFKTFCIQTIKYVYMGTKSVILTIRLNYLAELLGGQLGTDVTRAQAVNVAVKEAVKKREKGGKESS